MKKTLVAILSLTAGLAWGQAALPDSQTWLSFLSDADRATLAQKGELLDSAYNVSALDLYSAGPWALNEAQAWQGRITTVSAELLTVLNAPDADKPLSERLLSAFNAMNAVSTMKGTTYWSTMRKDWETLILDSYRVSAPEKADRLPDAHFTSIPPYLKMVVFQKDNKLGDGFTSIEITSQPDGFFVTMKNVDPLTYFFVPLVGAGDFQMTFSITFLKDKIAVYTVMGAKTIQFFGLEHSKDKSFRNRMMALAGWFTRQLKGTSS